ncbi:MAG TPA: hypothetical protein VEU97_03750 [Ktedonobacteraceae bacterium]|nr:hypothetical protein [Ktedonobacteraceae bacterium]
MPRGIIPNEQPRGFALFLQLGTAPRQKSGRDVTHTSRASKVQRHFLADGIADLTFLSQNAVAGQGLGISIALFLGFFHQMDRMLLILPSMHTRQGKALHQTSSSNPIAQVGCWLAQAIKRSLDFFTGIVGQDW